MVAQFSVLVFLGSPPLRVISSMETALEKVIFLLKLKNNAFMKTHHPRILAVMNFNEPQKFSLNRQEKICELWTSCLAYNSFHEKKRQNDCKSNSKMCIFFLYWTNKNIYMCSSFKFLNYFICEKEHTIL